MSGAIIQLQYAFMLWCSVESTGKTLPVPLLPGIKPSEDMRLFGPQRRSGGGNKEGSCKVKVIRTYVGVGLYLHAFLTSANCGG
jgi:hypothetical protein